MPNPTNLEQKRSTVTSTPTPNSARTVSYHKFEIEKDAKNEAYSFILSHGLFKEFAEFCKTYHSCNPHKDCVKSLLSKL